MNKPIVIDSDFPVPFDCDDTLVIWDYPPEKLSECIYLKIDITEIPLLPHKKHIEELKKHKARGHRVIVWSAGGWEWANEVVKKLELEEFVDVVMSKPRWFYDDLPSTEFMPEINRIYHQITK
jgi:hypothetical protein